MADSTESVFNSDLNCSIFCLVSFTAYSFDGLPVPPSWASCFRKDREPNKSISNERDYVFLLFDRMEFKLKTKKK